MRRHDVWTPAVAGGTGARALHFGRLALGEGELPDGHLVCKVAKGSETCKLFAQHPRANEKPCDIDHAAESRKRRNAFKHSLRECRRQCKP
eukprot:6952907-Prymnesium_polylepis.2